MATITIKTDPDTPNYMALAAVTIWMLRNKLEQDYQVKREVIPLRSGVVFSVEEIPDSDMSSVCSATFRVERLN